MTTQTKQKKKCTCYIAIDVMCPIHGIRSSEECDHVCHRLSGPSSTDTTWCDHCKPDEDSSVACDFTCDCHNFNIELKEGKGCSHCKSL